MGDFGKNIRSSLDHPENMESARHFFPLSLERPRSAMSARLARLATGLPTHWKNSSRTAAQHSLRPSEGWHRPQTSLSRPSSDTKSEERCLKSCMVAMYIAQLIYIYIHYIIIILYIAILCSSLFIYI